jgi:hypothetical protein
LPEPPAAQAKRDDKVIAEMALQPFPPYPANDDEDCEDVCERYNVSRTQDGCIVWSPEPLPAG